MKSLPTSLDGYTFRSRLEARWYLYLKGIGLDPQYEPQGIKLSSGDSYLPDFYLPSIDAWAEVKGKPLNALEDEKARLLCKETEKPVYLLESDPDWRPYDAYFPSNNTSGYTVERVNLFFTDKNKKVFEIDKHIRGKEDFENFSTFSKIASSAVMTARGSRFNVYEDKSKRYQKTQKTQ